jgi:hypothetical protein
MGKAVNTMASKSQRSLSSKRLKVEKSDPNRKQWEIVLFMQLMSYNFPCWKSVSYPWWPRENNPSHSKMPSRFAFDYESTDTTLFKGFGFTVWQ